LLNIRRVVGLELEAVQEHASKYFCYEVDGGELEDWPELFGYLSGVTEE
jgi:hypothetical protein